MFNSQLGKPAPGNFDQVLATDFWSIFGKYQYPAALVPCIVILGWIGIDGFLRRRNDPRIGFFSYAAIFLCLALITYLFGVSIDLNPKRTQDIYFPTRSTSYPITSMMGQAFMVFFAIALFFLINSLFWKDSRLKYLQWDFSVAFPISGIFIGLITLSLNERVWWDNDFRSDFRGFFGVFYRYGLVSNHLYTLVLILIFLTQMGYVFGIWSFIIRNCKEAWRLSGYTILTPLLLMGIFVIEMHLQWLGNEPILKFQHIMMGKNHEFEIARLHIDFWILISIWLGIRRFKNPVFERISREMAIGLVFGMILVMWYIPLFARSFVITN